ncbi:DUF4083 domain-containing protein [Priestia koreensis]|uniref:DUF4083 domain-containing protein n=1 Tax=Priestia koreensis TaxID=284581 RepID=UPI00203CB1B8|nr:DUF4083 domain-containing protein [Priestia koreensis]MCM3006336.1 DUF4083 domain-containing protein [Priestia koreensis]
MSTFNIGDAIYQLVFLALLVFVIYFIVAFFRSNKKRKTQLDRIEQKIQGVEERLNKKQN